MSRPAVVIRFDEPQRCFRPGETLAGHWRTEGLPSDDAVAFEVSVLWHTEGKGSEDFGVHHFQRITADAEAGFQERAFRRFETELPNSPLSYEGVIVRIHWCVRVRAFLKEGKELVGELSFRLGNVPTAVEVPS